MYVDEDTIGELTSEQIKHTLDYFSKFKINTVIIIRLERGNIIVLLVLLQSINLSRNLLEIFNAYVKRGKCRF